MSRRLSALLLVTTLVASTLPARASAPAGDETLGKGVTLAQATSIAMLYTTPEAFVGKTIRVDGVVSAVCDMMGCWMALADIVDPEKVVRFKVDHDAGIVFPIAAKGKAASAEGVFEKIAATDEEGTEAAAEHAGHASGTAADFGKTWQIEATGAVVR
jgi:hypothetical protein